MNENLQLDTFTILDKVFGTKKRNQAKLASTRNLWYLLLRNF